MYNDYFDFPEPSTGDIVFEELKKILLGTLKEEVKAELEALRKENEELRPLRKDKSIMEQQIRMIQDTCDRKVRDAETNARKLAFEELFSEHLVEAWKVGRNYIKGPKCDKCDSQRKLHFTSPRGKDMTESCECDVSTVVYKPIPALLTRFKVKPKARIESQNVEGSWADKPVYYWYTSNYDVLCDDCEFQLSDYSDVGVQRPSELKPFDKCSEYHSVFTSKERCQEFCEYLAAEDEKKSSKVV